MRCSRLHERYATLAELRAESVQPESRWLSEYEHRELERWRDPGRREAWLFGRVLSKQLLQQHLGVTASDPRSIEIRSTDNRRRGIRPEIRIDGVPHEVSLSISHTRRGVMAALSVSPNVHVGIDLTAFEDVKATLLETWFSVSERDRIRAGGPRELAAYWATKEAVYKACHNGESFAPRQFEVERTANGQYVCHYRGVDLSSLCDIEIRIIDQHIAATALLPSTWNLESTVSRDDLPAMTTTADWQRTGLGTSLM